MNGIPIFVSPGELLDRITILQIKVERVEAPEVRERLAEELSDLERRRTQLVPASAELEDLWHQLRRTNALLWDVEDRLRVKEALCEFDEHFVRLARSVYHHNDRRSALKQRVNELLGSPGREVKHFTAARKGAVSPPAGRNGSAS